MDNKNWVLIIPVFIIEKLRFPKEFTIKIIQSEIFSEKNTTGIEREVEKNERHIARKDTAINKGIIGRTSRFGIRETIENSPIKYMSIGTTVI